MMTKIKRIEAETEDQLDGRNHGNKCPLIPQDIARSHQKDNKIEIKKSCDEKP